jgi:amidase
VPAEANFMPPRDPYHAFTDDDVRLDGAASGPLAGLAFAAKDLFDIAGRRTGGGTPDWRDTHPPAAETAWAVARLVEAGADMVGKTHTDEVSRGIFGENPHFGTPANPAAPGRVPGGSSSGSAAAVAGGLVDFALGTDTGGSVRVPASFCGLYGIRTTHGRVPVHGVLTQAPGFDTVGWLARDAGTFARAGAVLLDSEIPDWSPRRVTVADDAFALADDAVGDALGDALDRIAARAGTLVHATLSAEGLDVWFRHQAVLQGREAWATFAAWIDATNPRFGFEVADNFITGRDWSDDAHVAALAARPRIAAAIEACLADDGVIALPTTPFPAPAVGQTRSAMKALRMRVITLTAIAGLAGTPQINLPLGRVGGMPVGLSLIGARGSDAKLIGFARALAAA